MATQPPADVLDFATRYQDPLNRAIRNRMLKVGVPDEMIGFEYPRIDDVAAFVRYPDSQIGGNSNPYRDSGKRPGLNLDYGVLDPKHLKMVNVPSWTAGCLKDRVDAAIAHEYTEALVRVPAGHDPLEQAKELHKQAIRKSPSTKLKITPGARKILREYCKAQGL